MENGPFIVDFPIKTSIYKGFSMAMLNKQMVLGAGSMIFLAQASTEERQELALEQVEALPRQGINGPARNNRVCQNKKS
jgi:hypothetical protein